MDWSQVYDPIGISWMSTIISALPVVVLLGGLGFFHMPAHRAAIAGLATALLIAIAVYQMPIQTALAAAGFGAAYGLLPIGWIVLNIIFLYQLTKENGQFEIMRNSIARITDDSRLQLLLIAFCFGAFFEGAAGFGTPVAVTGAMLIGLGFTRLQASGLSLIANTAPVAFGALGTPLITLSAVTGLDLLDLSAMVGRQMAIFCILVPAWLLVAYCGWRRTLEVWPAVLVTGVTFGLAQLLISNLHGPWLTAVGSALITIAVLVVFLRFWRPATIMHVNDVPLSRGDSRTLDSDQDTTALGDGTAAARPAPREIRMAWMPWLVLTVTIFVWGLPFVKSALDSLLRPSFEVPFLHDIVRRVPPVVQAQEIEPAIYSLNIMSATGTAILLASVASAFALGLRPGQIVATYGRSLKLVSTSLLTIAAMLSLGYVTRYSGIDATMGLAFAATGLLYPFFGTLLGWLGVAVTGSDTASNVLFGSLQKVTSEQLGLNPNLMAGANSAGGVMGKMIDAQSIVVASTATRWFGAEGKILRYVFVHSVVLATLMGIVVMLMAYVEPFTRLVVR